MTSLVRRRWILPALVLVPLLLTGGTVSSVDTSAGYSDEDRPTVAWESTDPGLEYFADREAMTTEDAALALDLQDALTEVANETLRAYPQSFVSAEFPPSDSGTLTVYVTGRRAEITESRKESLVARGLDPSLISVVDDAGFLDEQTMEVLANQVHQALEGVSNVPEYSLSIDQLTGAVTVRTDDPVGMADALSAADNLPPVTLHVEDGSSFEPIS